MIDPTIKRLLGLPANKSNKEVLRVWKKAATRVCKPCWELKYCPYGPFVEQSPLLPPLREEAIAHNQYLENCLKTEKLADGRRLDLKRKKLFREMVNDFRPEDYPTEISKEISEMQCSIFGHICPVVFVAEGFTETATIRRTGRYIPFQVKMRVVRRDNYTCQHCKKKLDDTEVEFDHIIPLSKGGSSEEANIRLTCFACNRDKRDKVQMI
jgi:hypothetical protein